MMKKIFTVLYVCIIGLTLTFTRFAGAAEIERGVYDEFQKRGDNAKISVIVRLKSQVTFRDIPRGVNRVNYVKRALETHARVSQSAFLDYLKSIDKNMKFDPLWIVNAVVAEVNRGTLELIAGRNEVETVSPNRTVELYKPAGAKRVETNKNSSAEWNIEFVNVPAVWEKYNLRGEGIKIGHIDTGCDARHSDIAGKIYAFQDFILTGSEAYNNQQAYDDQGHGTHTAGTIVGGDASGKAIGVAPRSEIAVAKVFDKNGSAKDDGILKAMQWIMDPDGNPATDDTPRLVSNSWGSSDLTKNFWDAVTNWRAANIYPLFAAGNSGPSPKTVGTPGGFPHSVAVGATTDADKAASFSSRGPVLWDNVSYIKPDVSAPGENIYSALPGGKWGTKSGTSMATPLVAGVIALLYQAKPDLGIDEITSILETSGRDLGETGKDNVFGSCRIDAYQAVTRVLNSGTLNIKVVSSDNNPLVAKVEIDGGRKFETKGDGTLKTTLEAGNYKVKIGCFGYITEMSGVAIEKDSVQNLNIVLKNAPLSSVTGVVTDQDNGLAVAASVCVVDTTIPPVQTDPKTGKFVISVPAGDYKLKVTAFKYKIELTDISVSGTPQNLKFELKPLPPVLLVGDTNESAKLSKLYKSALEAAGLKYTYYEVASSPDITSDFLIQYPLLIWFCAAESNKTLTAGDQAAITAYLNAGGSMMLTGQDIGYEIKDSQFLSSVLCAKYVADSTKSKNIGASSEVKEFEGYIARMDGTEGAEAQRYADVISRLKPAKILLNYQADDAASKTVAAVAVKTDTYRLIYMGFGFEGISGEAQRNDFIKRAVSFLMPSESSRVGSLAAAESRLDRNNNAGDILKSSEHECDSIISAVKKGDFEKLDAFINNFEKKSEADIYLVMAKNIRASIIHISDNGGSGKLESYIDKLSSLINACQK